MIIKTLPLALLLFKGVESGKLLCENRFSILDKPPTEFQIGACKLEDYEHKENSIQLSIRSDYTIEPEIANLKVNSSYSILRWRENTPEQKIFPDIINSSNGVSYHAYTHYFNLPTEYRKSFPQKRVYVCSANECIILTPQGNSIFMTKLLQSELKSCNGHFIRVEQPMYERQVHGICISEISSPNSVKIHTDKLFKVFYISPKRLVHLTNIERHITAHANEDSTFLKAIQKCENLNVFELSSKNQLGLLSDFALSHQLTPFSPSKRRVYIIQTPVAVYSLLQKANGNLTLRKQRYGEMDPNNNFTRLVLQFNFKGGSLKLSTNYLAIQYKPMYQRLPKYESNFMNQITQTGYSSLQSFLELENAWPTMSESDRLQHISKEEIFYFRYTPTYYYSFYTYLRCIGEEKLLEKYDALMNDFRVPNYDRIGNMWVELVSEDTEEERDGMYPVEVDQDVALLDIVTKDRLKNEKENNLRGISKSLAKEGEDGQDKSNEEQSKEENKPITRNETVDSNDESVSLENEREMNVERNEDERLNRATPTLHTDFDAPKGVDEEKEELIEMNQPEEEEQSMLEREGKKKEASEEASEPAFMEETFVVYKIFAGSLAVMAALALAWKFK